MTSDQKRGAEERLLDERRGWASEVEALEAQAEEELKPLDDAVGAAAEAMEAAKTALSESIESRRDASFNRATAGNRFSHQRDLLQQRLSTTSPAEIAVFVAELADEADRLHLTGCPHPIAFRKVRIAALGHARRAAEGLRMRALSQGELAAELSKIRGGISQGGSRG